MKKNIIICIIIGLGIMVSVVLTQFSFAQNKQIDTQQVALKTTSNKDLYLLGEPIQLFGEYINNSNKEVLIQKGKMTVIAVAKEGEDFLWYDADPRDCSFSRGYTLKSGESIKTNSQPYTEKNGVFLSNATARKPPLPLIECGNKDLDCIVKRQEMERANANERVTIFQDTGTYYAKYGADLIIDENNNKFEPIKTEPVKIQIVEPTGEDLEVWKLMNREDKYQFFSLMRDGWIDNRNQEAKDSFIKKVEQILLEYPDSTYSSYLRNGLDNFRKEEAKKEAEKAKQ